MGKPRSIETGDATAGARVEYIKSRRVIRLGGWHAGGREVVPVEVPTVRFLGDLGIDPGELGAAPLYLLVAGLRDSPRRGLRPMMTAYPSELEARHEFHLVRARHRQPDEWARLVTVDARCRVVPLCWFGGGEAEAAEEREAPVLRRRWAARRRQG